MEDESRISPLIINRNSVADEAVAAVEECLAVDEVEENDIEVEIPGEDATPDFECQPRDVRAPRTLWDPLLPSASEVAEHDLTHRPYRRWCPICIAAWGREDPHKRGGEGIQEGLPEVGMDYDHYGDPEDDEGEVTTLVTKDRSSGMIWGNVVERKGPGDQWIIDKQIKNIELLGRSNIALKTDGEPAIVAVQSKLISLRDGQTVPRNPPAYNPEANGPIEKGVQDSMAKPDAPSWHWRRDWEKE